jgi:hypothetical protein
MKLLESYINSLGLDKELFLEFFIIFSRFEYALKRAGFVTGNKEKASPDWKKFAFSLEGKFKSDRTQELIDAVNFLKSKPPKKQILKKGKLDWKDNPYQESEPVAKWLIDMVNIIRNNLFHGGKFPSGPIEEPSRNLKLLKSGLVVLYECLQLNDTVREFFLERD